MVFGYNCEEHGLIYDCDVISEKDDPESNPERYAEGERVCPECRKHVHGITEEYKRTLGEGQFEFGYRSGATVEWIPVIATTIEEAFEIAQADAPEGELITKIRRDD